MRISAAQQQAASKASAGHGAESASRTANGATQPRPTHKVFNTCRAFMILIVMRVGNVLVRAPFKGHSLTHSDLLTFRSIEVEM